jgi:hypothetical protein
VQRIRERILHERERKRDAARRRYKPLFDPPAVAGGACNIDAQTGVEPSRAEFLRKLLDVPATTVELLTYGEFAEYIGATWGTVKRWVHEGMPTETTEQYPWPRIRVEDGMAWLRNNPKRGSSLRRRSWVYFARAIDGRVKIGLSIDPERRVIELSSGNGKLELLAAIPGDMPTESHMHRAFDHLRIAGGEWFRPDAEMLRFIDALSRGELERPNNR